jgi:hypothetical protein
MERIGSDYVRYMADVFAYYEELSRDFLGREPSQVLLLHANLLNADYLGSLAEMLRKRGYQFISLDQALEDPANDLLDDYVGRRGLSWLQRWAITSGCEPGKQPEISEWVGEVARSG